MRVALIYHESAGDGLEHGELVRTIEAHGHEVLSIATPEDDGHRPETTGADCVVAAGGDGTIARVARALAHTGIPLAMLPLGTANNISSSLEIAGTVDALVAKWDLAQTRPLDLGLGTGPWGERRVVESLGGGLITHGIVVMDRRKSSAGPRDGEVDRALRAYRDLLPLIEPRPWRLRIDGREVEEDLILVEVLNTPRIGPNFSLTHDVHPDDGRFSVVMAGRSHRKEIADYLDARLQKRTALLDLPVVSACEVEIIDGDRLHLDDEVVGEADVHGVTIRIEPDAVRVLR